MCLDKKEVLDSIEEPSLEELQLSDVENYSPIKIQTKEESLEFDLEDSLLDDYFQKRRNNCSKEETTSEKPEKSKVKDEVKHGIIIEDEKEEVFHLETAISSGKKQVKNKSTIKEYGQIPQVDIASKKRQTKSKKKKECEVSNVTVTNVISNHDLVGRH